MAGRPVYFVEVTDMSAAKARQVVLAARPQGNPRLTDFRLEETAIPAPGPGQVLLRVQYLSLDPYMRRRMYDRESYAQPTPVGGVKPGESVASPTGTLSSPPIGSRSCGVTARSSPSATNGP